VTGIGGNDRTTDGKARGIAQVVLTDDLTQFLDDSGEHRLRLMSRASARDVAVTSGFGGG
jgi:hypothetical protein